MDTYETHIPILRALFSRADLRLERVLEYGMGNHSTRFFLERGCVLTSIEQQSEEWYDKVRQSDMPNKHNWYAKLRLDGDMGLRDAMDVRYDLGFVDGHQLMRTRVVNTMLACGAQVVVLHDTGLSDYYRLKQIQLPYGYNQYHYGHNTLHPRTSVFTKHDLKDMEVHLHHPVMFGT